MKNQDQIQVGDNVKVISHYQILQSKFDEQYPQGIFGKVLEIKKRFSPSTGDRLPDLYILRCMYKFFSFQDKHGEIKRWRKEVGLKHIQKIIIA